MPTNKSIFTVLPGQCSLGIDREENLYAKTNTNTKTKIVVVTWPY